jgi:hypothetical protein
MHAASCGNHSPEGVHGLPIAWHAEVVDDASQNGVEVSAVFSNRDGPVVVPPLPQFLEFGPLTLGDGDPFHGELAIAHSSAAQVRES